MNVTARTVVARGFTLLDALIALAILAFGMLALTGFQTKLVAQGTEAQHRVDATAFADELLNTMLVDNANSGCYTLPAAGGCASPVARASTDAWGARVLAALPGSPTVTSVIVANQMTVTITWEGKDSADTRTHQVISDIR